MSSIVCCAIGERSLGHSQKCSIHSRRTAMAMFLFVCVSSRSDDSIYVLKSYEYSNQILANAIDTSCNLPGMLDRAT